MSVSRASAARERESMSEISGVGNEAKSLVQEATRESSITKPGRTVGTYGSGSNGGVHVISKAVWSEPSESGKEMETEENLPVHMAESLRRVRSMMESRCPASPQRVAYPVGLTSERSESSNQSSREPAQLDTVAPGKDQVEECVLKSPTT